MIRVCATLVLFAVSLTANAAIYKWVDDDGVAQYSSTPPAGRDYELVRGSQSGKSAGDPGKELQKLREKSDEIDAERTEEKSRRLQAAADADVVERRKNRCERAQTNLSTLEQNTRLLLVDEDTGEERRLNEVEREAQIAQTKRDIVYYCAE